MLNSLHLPGCTDVDLYPQELAQDIDKLNDMVRSLGCSEQACST